MLRLFVSVFFGGATFLVFFWVLPVTDVLLALFVLGVRGVIFTMWVTDDVLVAVVFECEAFLCGACFGRFVGHRCLWCFVFVPACPRAAGQLHRFCFNFSLAMMSCSGFEYPSVSDLS